jgi:hypothetical protein
VQSYELPHLLRPFSPVKLPSGGELSEDLSFCWRWRQCGGDVWANVRHPIGHVGPFEWTIRYEDYLIERGAAARNETSDTAHEFVGTNVTAAAGMPQPAEAAA